MSRILKTNEGMNSVFSERISQLPSSCLALIAVERVNSTMDILASKSQSDKEKLINTKQVKSWGEDKTPRNVTISRFKGQSVTVFNSC